MYTRKTRKRGFVQKYKGGRVCKKRGCKQRLSVYNSEEFCHVHQQQLMR